MSLCCLNDEKVFLWKKLQGEWEQSPSELSDWQCKLVPGLFCSGTTIISHTKLELIVDFYQLLSLSKNASVAQIKSAYHRALLQSHPDKKINKISSQPVDIALIKEAYSTLSNSQLRTKYDAQLEQRSYSAASPRPAQIVSLEDFEEVDQNRSEVEDFWRYTCRCGGSYQITTTLMEKGEHLIACNSCSEVIWVGYELVES